MADQDILEGEVYLDLQSGALCFVLGFAKHSETKEHLVLFTNYESEGPITAMPLTAWYSEVKIDVDVVQPRFRRQPR